jgi:hypothetical protein
MCDEHAPKWYRLIQIAKNIKVIYFWLKELIDYGRSKLKYFKTDELVADILTNLSQVSSFSWEEQKLAR